MRGSREGGEGVRALHKNNEVVGFLSRPMMARFWSYLDPSSPHQMQKKKKKKKKKKRTNVKTGSPLTKLSGSVHERLVNE